MAFTGQADLILLDEPTTGLDPVNRRHVWDMIEKMKVGPSRARGVECAVAAGGELGFMR